MDVIELLDSVHLVDVRTIEETARLKLDASPEQGLAALDEADQDADLSIQLNPVSWGERIEIWFRFRYETPAAKLVAAVATLYQRTGNDEIPEQTRIEFIEKVAVMAAYPYLRNALQELAAKLRLGNITLDIMRQGSFRIGQKPSLESAD